MTRTRSVRIAAAVACVGLAAAGTAASAATAADRSSSLSGSAVARAAAIRALQAKPSADCPPARVTGLSYFIDVLTSGSSAGPSIVYGVASTVLGGESLPGALGTAQAKLLTAGANVVETISTDSPAELAKLRKDVAFLAAYNADANKVVGLVAKGLTTVSGMGATIAPFDVTFSQLASTVTQLEEQPPSSGAGC